MTEQVQGQPTSDTAAEPTNQVAPSGADGTTTSDSAKPEVPKGYVSQETVGKAAGKARDEGRKAATNELLSSVGLESADELHAIVQERRQAQEAQATEAEKLSRHLEKTTKERDEQKAELDELYAHIATLTQETALRDAFMTSNIKPERMAAALKLVDMNSLDVNDDGDVVGVEDAVKSVKKQLPELFQANNARTIGSGSSPGTEQISQPGFDTMDDAAFQEMRKRVLFGERIPLK